MKFLVACLMALGLVGCTSETPFGRCVGAFDDKDPALVYRVSTKNVVLAVFFSELIVPPVIVVLNETHCPVDVKK